MWVVRCVDYDERGKQTEVVVGPFRDREEVDDFMRDNSLNYAHLDAIPLLAPPVRTAIHVNQAQIGDYIDPSVAN